MTPREKAADAARKGADVPAQGTVREAAAALAVSGLTVAFGREPHVGNAVDGVDLRLEQGEILGIIGESGSGKSSVALAVLRLLPGGGRIRSGAVMVRGTDVAALTEGRLRHVRGGEVGMVFQDPMSSLNPLLPIGRHLDEALRAHGGGSRAHRRERAVALLDLVGIPDAARRMRDRPHQFSGGMRQRVAIALALANDPAVLIADEPTTALDATVGAQILGLIRRINSELGTSVVLITHDIGVVERTCDAVAVMYAGKVVEQGAVESVLTLPRHPYTAGLLAAVPRLDAPAGSPLAAIPGAPPGSGSHGDGCRFAPRCHLALDHCRKTEPALIESRERLVACHVTGKDPEVPAGPPPGGEAGAPGAPGERTAPDALTPPNAADPPGESEAPGPGRTEPLLEVTGLTKRFTGRRGLLRTEVTAFSGVDLSLLPGETLGLVGESGSGKSTLARTLVGLHSPDAGRLRFRGAELTAERGPEQLRRIQMVFQDPYSSLHPRMRVGTALAEALRAAGVTDPERRRERTGELLRLVGLDEDAARRRPGEFSGGQRQRIGIARALATEPELLVCDEPVSALDVSVQARVLNLLAGLRESLGLSMIFISHDLAVVRQISHRIAVLYRGELVEVAAADELCTRPQHPYTASLLAAASPTPSGTPISEPPGETT